MIPLSAQVWGLRILFLVGLVLLCTAAGSGFPSLAFSLAWGPNGLFLFLWTRGTLRLPRALVSVHAMEPVLYRWLGVGFIKRIVATRMWPLVNGNEPPTKLLNRQELLVRTEQSTMGAEVCHFATFVVVLVVNVFYLAIGRFSEAGWIFAFNLLFNGYPVMLQRANRWRVQQLRAGMRVNRLSGEPHNTLDTPHP